MSKVIAKVKIVFDKSVEEWIVRAYDENGKRMPECDYFTNDKTDAQQTADLMLRKKENAPAPLPKPPTEREIYARWKKGR